MFPSVPAFFLDFFTLEDGTDRLSRNTGTELALNAQQRRSLDYSYEKLLLNFISVTTADGPLVARQVRTGKVIAILTQFVNIVCHP